MAQSPTNIESLPADEAADEALHRAVDASKPAGEPATAGPAVPSVPAARSTGGSVRQPGRWSATATRVWVWLSRWVRDYFAPDRVVAFLKSLLWVAPLTALIWIYAERQQQYTLPNQVLPVEVVSGDPNQFALVQRPIDGNVVVTLRGPKAAIDRVTEQLKLQAGGGPIQIRADRTGRDGEQNLIIPTARIGQDKRFLDAGITIVSAQPESLVVRLEPMVDWDLPIQPRQRDQYPNVEFTPDRLRVRGPASAVGNRNDPRDPLPRVMVYADLNAPPDQETVLRNVKVALSTDNRNVTVTVPASGVTARVRPGGMDTLEIRSLPVKVVPGQFPRDLYDFVDPPPLFNVIVTGPKDKIDKLRDPATPPPMPYAELSATAAPPEAEAQVRYQFEPGVTLTQGPATIKVTITPRR
jgi:hypothetical protein